jgi:hypothetical protein
LGLVPAYKLWRIYLISLSGNEQQLYDDAGSSPIILPTEKFWSQGEDMYRARRERNLHLEVMTVL